MKKEPIDLNDYYKQQSSQLTEERFEQSLLSSEAFIKQAKRVAFTNQSLTGSRSTIKNLNHDY